MRYHAIASLTAAVLTTASIPLIASLPQIAAVMSLTALPVSVIGESAVVTAFASFTVIAEAVVIRGFNLNALVVSAALTAVFSIIKSYFTAIRAGRVSRGMLLRDVMLVSLLTALLGVPALLRHESLFEPIAAVCIAGIAGFGVGAAVSAAATGRVLGLPRINGLGGMLNWLSKHLIDVLVASALTASLTKAYMDLGLAMPVSLLTSALTTALLLKVLTSFRMGRVALLCLTLALTAAFIRWRDIASLMNALKIVNGVLNSLGW